MIQPEGPGETPGLLCLSAAMRVIFGRRQAAYL
jgi:hypothetical protein